MIDPDPTFKDNDIIFKLTGLEKQTRIDEPGKSLKYLWRANTEDTYTYVETHICIDMYI